jgi:hypothetical protein
LHVECGDQGNTSISGRTPYVQRDGIHLLVTNNTGAPVNRAVGTAAYFGLRTSAETEVVFGLAPGKWAVQCFEGKSGSIQLASGRSGSRTGVVRGQLRTLNAPAQHTPCRLG